MFAPGDIETAGDDHRGADKGPDVGHLAKHAEAEKRDPDKLAVGERRQHRGIRIAVAESLTAHGVHITGTDGINLWMEVADERTALITLAAQGIGAAPGAPFMVRPGQPCLRVTVGLIDHDLEGVARRLADAAGANPGSARLR